MKTIRLTTWTTEVETVDEKTGKATGEMEEIEFATLFVLQFVTNQVKQIQGQGLNLIEVEKRTRVIRALADAEKAEAETVDLEDADFNVLHACFKTAEFFAVNERLVDIRDHLARVSKGEPEPGDEKPAIAEVPKAPAEEGAG